MQPCHSNQPLSSLGSEVLTWDVKLRGKAVDERARQDKLAVGGLRNARHTVSRLHLVASFGAQLGVQLEDLLSAQKGWIDEALAAIGNSKSLPNSSATLAVRQLLGQASAAGPVGPVDNGSCTSPVFATLLRSWQNACSDPDDQVADWFLNGAPVLRPLASSLMQRTTLLFTLRISSLSTAQPLTTWASTRKGTLKLKYSHT